MDAVYRDTLRRILEDGEVTTPSIDPFSPHSRFGSGGGGMIEMRDQVLDIPDHRSIRLQNGIRRASFFRGLGMSCWNLTASPLVSDVAIYNRGASVYADDGSHVRAPWGMRMLSPDGQHQPPLLAALELLASDPATLRAFVPVFWPVDVNVPSRDVPCLIGISLGLRHDTLYITATFRALNAYSVFPYDHCLLCIVSEAVRAHLGCGAVKLRYFVNSLHISSSDVDSARLAIAEGPFVDDLSLNFPKGNFGLALADLRVHEPRMRAAYELGDAASVETAIVEVEGSSETWAACLLRLLTRAWSDEAIAGSERRELAP